MSDEPLPRLPRPVVWVAGVSLLYALLALASLLLAARPGQVATLWFANSVGTVALLALPRRQWPLMLAGLGAVGFVARRRTGNKR